MRPAPRLPLALLLLLPLTLAPAPGCRGQERATGRVPAWLERGTGMSFVRVPHGRFVMGSPPDEPGREAQERAHVVEITRDFWLGRHEVTQGQWRAVMGTNPSWFASAGPDHPVERVTYRDVEAFIDRLAARSGERFRLPTEAEWEYACRAGSTAPFATGANLTTADANFDGRYPYAGHAPGVYRGRTTPVGRFRPNAWGVYDMHGNVWEWTSDDHGPYAEGPLVDGALRDPAGAPGGAFKVIRGGSWAFDANSARCALRYTHRPDDRGYSLGFRLVRVSPADR